MAKASKKDNDLIKVVKDFIKLNEENMKSIGKNQKISNGILKKAKGDWDKAAEMMKEHADNVAKESDERNNKLIKTLKAFDELTKP